MEKADQRVAVVLADDIDHQVVEFVFQAEIDAFFDVRKNDERAHRGSEVVMGIDPTGHVFGEIFRLHHLPDVVEISADPADGRIRADGFGTGLGEVGHGEAVMVSARRLEGHAFEQGMIQVGRLEPRNIRGNAEDVLEDG